MLFFKDKNTGDVHAYTQDDLDKASNLTTETPQVFQDIAEKLKGMIALTDNDVMAHLHPQPTAEQVRRQRDSLLYQVDSYVSNPLRWADTSSENKELIADYRKRLLEVPQQTSFPTDTIWPEIPPILNSEHITQ